MAYKKTRFEALRDGDELPGYKEASTKMSGLRKKTNTTQYAEGPRTTERPMQKSDEPLTDVKIRVLFETLIEPAVARARLREIGLDDDLEEKSALNSVTFPELINKKIKTRDNVISVLCKSFCYEWWNSTSPVERLWGQLNNAFMIIPKWQYFEDMKAVLCKRMDTMRPAGFAGVDLLVLRENKEAVKKHVYNRLVTDGFMDGDHNKVYTDAELDAIIATKQEDE